MAAAEARAVWQRAANRCFVQDAKRAPKLPPSSSLSASASPPNTSTGSSQQSHGHYDDEDNTNNNNNVIDEHQQHLILNLTPLSRNPYPISTANLPPDTRWWLQLHPNFAYQREFLLYDPKSHVNPPHPATTHDPLSPSPDFDIAFYQPDEPNTSLSMSFTKHGNSNTIDRNGEDKKLSYDVKSYEDTLMLKKSEPWWRVADGEDLA
ncbi:Alanine--tRNA ligase [Rhynchospora pubera]|uniref:Alanine--tRNA ligase n=1 Tax=Rhynchospora pubera TaxID=906938 RepID=A0AAV8HT01_9POAL|nr:Alanine--tRNA ligase [Rhynchospora pubera]